MLVKREVKKRNLKNDDNFIMNINDMDLNLEENKKKISAALQ
jgi:hypothetical protein